MPCQRSCLRTLTSSRIKLHTLSCPTRSVDHPSTGPRTQRLRETQAARHRGAGYSETVPCALARPPTAAAPGPPSFHPAIALAHTNKQLTFSKQLGSYIIYTIQPISLLSPPPHLNFEA